MSKIKVALVFGGKSGEHEVSVTSAMSIYNALDKTKYDITFVGIDKSGRWLLPDETRLLAKRTNPRLIKLNEVLQDTIGMVPFPHEKNIVSLTKSGTGTKVDVVFPVLHGTFGEDGTIQGLIELAGLPYVGSGVLGSSIGMDKDVSKRLLRDAGIPVVPFITITRTQFQKDPTPILEEAKRKFGFPYFVKPANTGSSVGVHKVKNDADARTNCEDAFKYDTKILIEQAVDAREIECAVLGNHEPQASILGEIIPHHEFYSYEAKYIDQDGADLKIPAENLDKATSEQIRNLAVQTFKVLECRGMARVDFFLDRKTGKIYLNEINTIPGFTSISMYPKLWEATGIPYSKLLDRLIELAIEQHAEKAALKTSYEPK